MNILEGAILVAAMFAVYVVASFVAWLMKAPPPTSRRRRPW